MFQNYWNINFKFLAIKKYKIDNICFISISSIKYSRKNRILSQKCNNFLLFIVFSNLSINNFYKQFLFILLYTFL